MVRVRLGMGMLVRMRARVSFSIGITHEMKTLALSPGWARVGVRVLPEGLHYLVNFSGVFVIMMGISRSLLHGRLRCFFRVNEQTVEIVHDLIHELRVAQAMEIIQTAWRQGARTVRQTPHMHA